mmetsp:Transcript_3262/g.10501  ORF Transcript_3262/g.10501 Transcript_3262/m.10501 type:complete len:297 (-) Transcript_3262:32-922(-)
MWPLLASKNMDAAKSRSSWAAALCVSSGGALAANCETDAKAVARARCSPCSTALPPLEPPNLLRLRSNAVARSSRAAWLASVPSTPISMMTLPPPRVSASALTPASPTWLRPMSREKSTGFPRSARARRTAPASSRPVPRSERHCRPGWSRTAEHQASRTSGQAPIAFPSSARDRAGRRPCFSAAAMAREHSLQRSREERSTNLARHSSLRYWASATAVIPSNLRWANTKAPVAAAALIWACKTLRHSEVQPAGRSTSTVCHAEPPLAPCRVLVACGNDSHGSAARSSRQSSKSMM